MLKHICRLMIFIFLFNTIAPQLAQAQQVPTTDQIARSVQERVNEATAARVTYSINMSEEEALTVRDTRLEELADLYDEAETPQEIQKIVGLMHKAYEEYNTFYKEPKDAKDREAERLRQQEQNRFVQPNDAIPTAVQMNPRLAFADQEAELNRLSMARDNFLRRLNNDEISPDELVEYVDPLDPTQDKDLVLTTYAGEVLSNDFLALTLAREEEIDQETIEALVPFALRLQQRVHYRLNHLNGLSLNNSGVIMSRGTLRLLLFRIHQFLDKFKKEDPFASTFAEETSQNSGNGNNSRAQVPQRTVWIEYPTQSSYNAYKRRVEAQNAQYRKLETTRHLVVNIIPSYEVYKAQHTRRYTRRPTTAVPRGYTREEINPATPSSAAGAPARNNTRGRQATPPPDFKIPDNPMWDFVKEFKQLREKDPKAGSEDFYNLQLQMEYTTRYFLLTLSNAGSLHFFRGNNASTNVLNIIIDALEKKPSGRFIGEGYNPTNYETQYSAIIDDFYHTLYETVRGFPTEAGSIVLDFLEASAGPNHATDTRVSALAAASLLNRAMNPKPVLPGSLEYLARQQEEKEEKATNHLAFDNRIFLSDELRDKLGKYVVDIYEPLVRYNYEDYGQDSDQMVAMGDMLAYIYEGFLPLLVPGEKWEKNNCPGYPSVRRADYENGIMLQGLEDNSHGYVTQVRPPSAMGCQEDEFATGATIVLDSQNRAIGMMKYNYPNKYKVKDEHTALFFRIVGEAVLWIYGGEIIAAGFRAFSCMRGALSALPRAIKAANAVNKGSKWGRFTAKMRQGIRYSTFNSNLARNGVMVSATRTERVRVGANTLQAAPEGTPLLTGGRTASSAGTVVTEAPVTRAGTGYVTGVTNQPGTRGFFGRVWNKITGRTPDVTSYNVAIHRPGMRFAGAELDAASLGLTRGLNSPMEKALFQRAYQRAITNAPESFEAWRAANATGMDEAAARMLYNSQREAAQRVAQEFLNPLDYAGRQLISNERTFMAATADALKMDATAAGLNSGKFDYWAYDGQKWMRVSAQEFQFRGQFLNNAPKSYYELLGVSPQASTQEITKAYRRLALQYHPDKLGHLPEAARLAKEAEFSQISQAAEVLRNAEKRAAYDAALAKLARESGQSAQQASRVSSLFRPVLPKSPEGFSLAITPKTGVYPEGGTFNPITGNWEVIGGSTADGTLLSHSVPGVKGLGFNGTNWGTGDISAQVTQHLINEGQLSTLGDLVLSNTPFMGAFKSNLKFFAGWDILDRGASLIQQPYLKSKAQQELQNEMGKYGDVFENTNSGATGSAQLSPDNWNVYNQIVSAKQTDHRGALITLPYLVTRQTLSEHGIGTTPLLNDQTRAMLSTAAQTIRLNRALAQRQIVKNDKTFASAYETVLRNISAAQQDWQKNLSNDSTLWRAELDEINDFFEDYKRQLKDVADSSADASTKINRMSTIITSSNAFLENFNGKIETKLDSYLMAQAAPQGVDKWYTDLFNQLDEQRRQYAEGFALTDAWNELAAKVDRVFATAINSLQASRNQHDSFAQQYNRYTTIIQKWERDLAAVLQNDTQWQNMTQSQQTQSLEMTYGPEIMALYKEENVLVVQQMFGDQAKAETEVYCDRVNARMAAILGNSSLSLEEKRKQADALMEEYANYISTLLQKYEEAAPQQQGPAAGGSSVTDPGAGSLVTPPATTVDMSQDDEMYEGGSDVHSLAY